MEVFYQDLDIPTGDFLKLEYELEELYQRVKNFQGEKFLITLETIEGVLISCDNLENIIFWYLFSTITHWLLMRLVTLDISI